MRRFLLLLLVGFLYLVWRILGRRKDDTEMGWRTFSRVHKKKQSFGGGGDMVKDPVCDTYIPRNKAVEAHGRYFCSTRCAEQWDHRAKTS